MKRLNPKKLLLLLSLFVCIYAIVTCQNNPPIEEEKIVYFQSEKLQQTTTKEDVVKLLDIYNLDPIQKSFISTAIKYNVSRRRIIYKTTDAFGSSVNASGLIFIPEKATNTKGLSIGVLLHGTLQDKLEAPSMSSSSFYLSLATALSSFGGIIVVPDYVGYGESVNYLHAYEHTSLGKEAADIILATKEYCKQSNIKIYDKTFITGYSQGGSNCVSAHKYIEENLATQIPIYQTVAGSGAYDKLNFSKEILSQTSLSIHLPVYLWVLNTYRKIYQINYPQDSIFNEPFLSIFKKIDFDFSFGLFDHVLVEKDKFILKGNKLEGLTLDFVYPQKLFRASFIEKIKNEDPSLKVLIDGLKENTLIHWAPKAKLTLCYGTIDSFVFPSNSINAFNTIKAKGGNVAIEKYENKGHDTAFFSYLTTIVLAWTSLISESL